MAKRSYRSGRRSSVQVIHSMSGEVAVASRQAGERARPRRSGARQRRSPPSRWRRARDRRRRPAALSRSRRPAAGVPRGGGRSCPVRARNPSERRSRQSPGSCSAQPLEQPGQSLRGDAKPSSCTNHAADDRVQLGRSTRAHIASGRGGQCRRQGLDHLPLRSGRDVDPSAPATRQVSSTAASNCPRVSGSRRSSPSRSCVTDVTAASGARRAVFSHSTCFSVSTCAPRSREPA